MLLEELAERVGYGVQTLRALLDRAEFADIRPPRYCQSVEGVTEEHIERLIELRTRRKLPGRWNRVVWAGQKGE